MRFHLIDRIDEISYGKYISGVKCVSLADDVFDEHFPGYPVFPGSLIIESLAQLGGSLFELMMKNENISGRRSILSIVNNIKFKKPVVPGDRLLLRADILSYHEDFGVVKVKAENEGKICASGELTFTFVDIDIPKLQETRMELYNICTKNTRTIP